jgi:hypothetical protein
MFIVMLEVDLMVDTTNFADAPARLYSAHTKALDRKDGSSTMPWRLTRV